MKLVTCNQCRKLTQMNKAAEVLGRTLCFDCGNAELASIPKDQAGAVARLVDPTVCAKCQSDNGQEELPTVGGMPVCEACGGEYRNRPFPTWVKLAAAALVALVATSFIHNWRFFKANIEQLQAQRAMKAGKLEQAATLLASASRRVPEVAELKEASEYARAVVDASRAWESLRKHDLERASDLMESAARRIPPDARMSTELAATATMFRAMVLLKQEKSAEAVALLKQCQPNVPAQGRSMVDRLLVQAEIGAAYDRKDYDAFLDRSQALLKIEPNDRVAVEQVASAYAAKYAATGDEAFKRQALDFLEKAKGMPAQVDPTEPDDFQARIRYRLETREIIDRDEYRGRFPPGKPRDAKP